MFLEGACRLTRFVRAGHLKVANKVHAPSHPILASRARSLAKGRRPFFSLSGSNLFFTYGDDPPQYTLTSAARTETHFFEGQETPLSDILKKLPA